MDNTQHPGARRWLALLLLVQLGLSLLYMFYVPAFEKRDEEMHFEVISFFRHEKRLPDFRSDPPARVHEFFQPPLYHALSALIIAPLPESDPPLAVLPSNRFGYVFKGSAVPDNANRFLHNPDDLRFPWKGDWLAIYTLRFAALLMGLGTTFAMYHLARTVFQSESAALGATLWLILRPSILFETTAVTNDPLLLLLGTLLLLITARTAVEGVSVRRTVFSQTTSRTPCRASLRFVSCPMGI
jgi:hypothetical protein